MNRVLWVLQVVFGLYFVAVGVMHFIVPDGLPAQMEWMYELSDTLHTLAGIVEILGGLGLILPAVTGIRPELTSYAAFGLALVMIAAIFWHAARSEWTQIGFNVVNAAVLAFIGYGRMRLHPIGARSS